MTKILLVEDDKSLSEIYSVRLRAEGYDILSASDGEQALALAIKEVPDLIIHTRVGVAHVPLLLNRHPRSSQTAISRLMVTSDAYV